MNREYDVVVVGCGIAGLSAALSSAEHGAKVAILERSSKAVRGGNTRYTEAFMRLKSKSEVTDDFASRLAQTSEELVEPGFLGLTLKPYDEWPSLLRAYSFADPEIIRVFVDNVPDSVAWLESFGLRFEPESAGFLVKAMPRLGPVGGGEEIVERLASAAEKRGIDFYYETTAQSLNLDKKGRIIGVRAWSRPADRIDFKCKAVILACGGFEGNPEMLTKYMGNSAYLLRPISRGTMCNKGEGIKMALQAGAAPAGQYDSFHAEPIDPRSSRSEPSIFAFPYGILVNQLGERFVDEGADFADLIYEEISRTIWRQPGGKAYFIYDSKIEDIKNYRISIHSEQPPITSGSVEELASKLGIKPAALRNTIEAYNAAVKEGEFDPFTTDGKHTEGIQPPKSNWARRIEGPELMAYPFICAVVFTFGGVKVSPKAQVLNCDGYEIPGLYAAGEMIGLYYRSYPGSTSVLRGLVFGRIAGQDAATWAANSKAGK